MGGQQVLIIAETKYLCYDTLMILLNDSIKNLILDLGSWGPIGKRGLVDEKKIMQGRKCRKISIKASGVSGFSFSDLR